MANDLIDDHRRVNRATQQPLQGGHPMIPNSTRNDQSKIVKVGGDVERKAVHRHPPGDANAQRSQLLAIDPDTDVGVLLIVSPRFHSEMGDGSNEHLLQIPHVAANIATVRGEVENRIADQLPRTVIGHVSPPPRFVQFHAKLGSTFGRDEDVRPRRRTPQRDDVRMFEEKERVRDLLPLALLDEPTLEFVRLAIRETPKRVNVADPHTALGAPLPVFRKGPEGKGEVDLPRSDQGRKVCRLDRLADVGEKLIAHRAIDDPVVK